MTLDEVSQAQPGWTKRFGSSACGRYQFMRDTLDKPGTVADLKGELGLSGDALFSADLQDRLGYHLLKRRGYERFMAGRIGIVAFGKALAQEWASLPVLAAVKGQKRKVSRGQSYYAGDGLNKSLVKPERVEAVLDGMLASPAEQPVPVEPEPVVVPTKPRIPTGRWAEQALAVYEVKAIQQRYRDLGYFMVGKVDGIWGPATTATTIALQTQTGITADGHWGPQTKAALDDDANRYVVPAARANTTASDLRAQGSKIAIGGNRVTWSSVWSVLVTAFGVASYAAQNWDGSAASLPWPLGMVLGFAPPWVAPVLIVALNLYNALAAQGIVKARVDAERTGLHNGEPEPASAADRVASPRPELADEPDPAGEGSVMPLTLDHVIDASLHGTIATFAVGQVVVGLWVVAWVAGPAA